LNKYIIVDIDETLVYSRSRHPDSLDIQEYPGDCTLPRPGSHEFLQKAKDEGWRIISLTQGVVPFQREVLRTCGLLDYFEEIYGWTNVQRYEATRPTFEADDKWVMVDNLTHYDLYEKAMWLQTAFEPGVNFIKCEEFWGHYEEEHCLTTLLPKIKEMLDGPPSSTI